MQGEFEHDEVHSEGSAPQVRSVNETRLLCILITQTFATPSVHLMNCKREPMGP